jgi:hypothetical protein
MQRRARELAIHAIEQGQAWVSRLGVPPREEARRERWLEAISAVAAYRDRWNIGDDRRPIGPSGGSRTIEEASHRERAALAVGRARQLSSEGLEPRKPYLGTEPAAVAHLLPTGVDL